MSESWISRRLHELVGQLKGEFGPETPQLPRIPCGSTSPVDVLLIDVSASMTEADYPPSRLDGAKQASRRFLEQRARAQPRAQAGVACFSTKAHVMAEPMVVGTDYPHLQDAIDVLRPQADTNLQAGLKAAGRMLERYAGSPARRVILLTDGHANQGDQSVSVAGTLKAEGIQIDIIGIGGSPSDVDEPALRRMASVVNGELRYWFIKSVPDLVKRFEALALREID